MTQENKQLLLQDLCTRLPYGVKIEITWWVAGEGTYINTTLEPDHIDQLLNDDDTEIKPYLRPLSSMTREELHECQEILGPGVEIQDYFIDITDSSIKRFTYLEIDAVFVFLNKKMFDFRGLIPKGLALEAPEGMYKI